MLETAADLGSFSVVSVFTNADLVVKSVIFILILASFLSWAIIFDKFVKLRMVNLRSRQFEKQFASGKQLFELYELAKGKHRIPVCHLFVTAIDEWKRYAADNNPTGSQHYLSLKDRIYQTMLASLRKAISDIEKNISFLAVIASSAPFIGLFGTVWGIMNSFSAIATTQNAGLAVVAPGISEALFATAIGLFAAIPALIFYNLFASQINHINIDAEDFSVEVINILAREIDGKG